MHLHNALHNYTMPKNFITAFILLYFYAFRNSVYAQDTFRKIIAKRTSETIKIDGKLNEPDWKTAPIATDFVELNPTPFKHEDSTNRTDIYFMYNDQGIY